MTYQHYTRNHESFEYQSEEQKTYLKPDEKKEKFNTILKEHNVPEWYIGSCEKIKYMFPKAHAVAYVMMAWRIAYCKINHPLAYYAAYFSIRAKAFNYELMCQGKNSVESHLKEYDNKENLSQKEENEYSKS